MSTTRSDGHISVAVPTGETWKSGEIRRHAGRFGVVRLGPDVAAGESCDICVGRDLEVEVTTTVAVVAGTVYGLDIATQRLVAGGAGDGDVAYAPYAAAANTKVRVFLN